MFINTLRNAWLKNTSFVKIYAFYTYLAAKPFYVIVILIYYFYLFIIHSLNSAVSITNNATSESMT
jgi:hypothetical protein